MFTDMDINGNPINDEIFNERLLTDVGYQQRNNINTVNVLDAENEFGVWLKVIGGENVIGQTRIKDKENQGNFIR